MSNHVSWLLELSLKEGEYDNLIALMEEMVSATQADEPGALNYEWSVSTDKQSCHIYERYADSAATMVHLGNFGTKFAGRFMSILTPTRFTVYGSPNDTVLGALKSMGVVHMPSIGGFTRYGD
jgi:quinol monooxygenase YgiN